MDHISMYSDALKDLHFNLDMLLLQNRSCIPTGFIQSIETFCLKIVKNVIAYLKPIVV